MKTFELKNIIEFYKNSNQKGIKTVLISLVGLNGSSYRKPGVRMAIAEDGSMSGAISGGCVENEVYKNSLSVFKTNTAKVISYDGRYRLGCEGMLYILIEPLMWSDSSCALIAKTIDDRESFEITSYYQEVNAVDSSFGSVFKIGTYQIPVQSNFRISKLLDAKIFSEQIDPDTQLVIIGAEHDAKNLCESALLLGWKVTVIISPTTKKNIEDFNKGAEFYFASPETVDFTFVDGQTAIVLMNHNFSKDVNFIVKLIHAKCHYIGILGSKKRKIQLENHLIDIVPNIDDSFFDSVYSPAGVFINAETPEEIAVSIIAEIIKVMASKKSLNKIKTFTVEN